MKTENESWPNSKMALSDICELSSILNVDDQEKIDLERKKIALNSSIKQQEGRFFRELEEKERLNCDVSHAKDILEEFAADIEMKLLTVSQIKQDHEEKFSPTKIITEFKSYHEQHNSLQIECQTLQCETVALEEKFSRIELATDTRIGDKVSNAQQELIALTSTLDICNAEYAELKRIVALKEDAVEVLDTEQADIELTKETLHAQIKNMAEEAATLTRENTHLKTQLEKIKAVSTVEFVALEEKTRKNIITIADLNVKTCLEVKNSKEFAQQVQDLMLLTDGCHESLTALNNIIELSNIAVMNNTALILEQSTESSLTEAVINAISSELATTLILRKAGAVHSFQSKAEALAIDLQETLNNIATINTEMELLNKQLLDNNMHEEMSMLLTALQGKVAKKMEYVDKLQKVQTQRCSCNESLSTVCAELANATAEQSVLTKLKNEMAIAQESLEERIRHKESDLMVLLSDTNSVAALETDCLNEQLILEHLKQQVAQQDQLIEGATLVTEQLNLEQRRLLQQQTTEETVAQAKLAFSYKQNRLAAQRDNRVLAHRQTITMLRQSLYDEDKLFQQNQRDALVLRTTAEFVLLPKNKLRSDLTVLTMTLANKQNQLNDRRQFYNIASQKHNDEKLRREKYQYNICKIQQVGSCASTAIQEQLNASIKTGDNIENADNLFYHGSNDVNTIVPASLTTDDANNCNSGNNAKKKKRKRKADGTSILPVTTDVPSVQQKHTRRTTSSFEQDISTPTEAIHSTNIEPASNFVSNLKNYDDDASATVINNTISRSSDTGSHDKTSLDFTTDVITMTTLNPSKQAQRLSAVYSRNNRSNSPSSLLATGGHKATRRNGKDNKNHRVTKIREKDKN